jgi:hypothetical protein
MNRALHIQIQDVLLALVTLALLSVPFAHRAGAAPVTPEITQYLSLGGSLSDICGDTDLHIAGGCESCQIVGSMLLPSVNYTAWSELTYTAIHLANSEAGIVTTLPHFASPPVRAPPAV